MERDSGGGKTRTEEPIVPSELVTEILLRVPVKSLLRLKTVCKLWYSLISDPHFAKSHFDLGAARTDRLALLDLSVPNSRSIDVNASLFNKSAVTPLNFNFLPSNPSSIRILGSCRGFLVLQLNYNPYFYMCNPATGLYKFIGRSPISFKDCALSSFIQGFGYDASTDDYLVVQSFYNPPHEFLTRVEYYSLRANAWKEIEINSFPYKRFYIHRSRISPTLVDSGVFFNGAIHWLVSRYDVSKHVILTFDLKERTFSEISLPINFGYGGGSYKSCVVRVLGDLLSVCAVRLNFSMTTEIWVMKEYKDQSSWTRTISVSIDDSDFPTRLFFPICITKDGDIVGRDVRTVLVKCNARGQVRENRFYVKGLRACQMAMYTESLLSLPCHRKQVKAEK